MSSENATVNVSNISSKATEQEIRNFFSFCGKIDSFNLTPSSSDVDAALSATITFEKPSAARTALLLDNTQLQGLPIHVTAPASLTDLQHDAEQHAHDGEEIRQEDKPRTAIVAEYLAHGYVLGDKALQTSIELDEKHGISSKFTSYLNNLNSRFKVAEKTRAADTSYGITRRATQGMNTATRYLESALNTPTGQKVRAFYEKGSKQVLDIHNEARRLADLREAEEHKCTCATAGPEGQCNCAPGSCDCNTKTTATSSSEKPSGSTSEAPPPSYPAEKATYQ